jgi:hypothetical protein
MFSYFARPYSFSAVPTASGPVCIFCPPVLVFDGTEGVGSRFHILPTDTPFLRYGGSGPVFMFCAPRLVFGCTEGVGSRFHVLGSRTRFRRCRVRRVPFSYFALPNLFSAVPSASGPVFIFCAPRLVFGCTEDVVSRFHVLFSRTHFQQYSTVPSASGPVFMFCAPRVIFGGNEGVGSRFHVLRARTVFRR